MTYLIVHGEVEIGPGTFEPGIVASIPCADHAAAQAEWVRLSAKGLYEEPWERPEYRDDAPTLGDLVPEAFA